MTICGCRRCQASCRRGGETVSKHLRIFTEAKAALDAYEDAQLIWDGSGPHIKRPAFLRRSGGGGESHSYRNAIFVMARRWNNDLSATFGILDRLNLTPVARTQNAIDNVKHLKVQVAAFMLE